MFITWRNVTEKYEWIVHFTVRLQETRLSKIWWTLSQNRWDIQWSLLLSLVNRTPTWRHKTASCITEIQRRTIPVPHMGRQNRYRKIPKISPSMYKPLQTGNAKKPPINRPSKHKPPPPRGGALLLEKLPLQRKTVNLIPTQKASPIDFETQISLRR